MLTIAGTNTLYFLILCLLKPYKEKRANKIRITSEFFFTLGTIGMVRLAYQEYVLLPEADYRNYGWFVAIMFGTAGLVEFTALLSKKFKGYIIACKKSILECDL